MLQRHHLRRIVRVQCSDRLSYKTTLETCYKQATIEVQLLQRRGDWVGHVLRMGDGRLTMQLLLGNLEACKLRQGTKCHTRMAQYRTFMNFAAKSDYDLIKPGLILNLIYMFSAYFTKATAM